MRDSKDGKSYEDEMLDRRRRDGETLDRVVEKLKEDLMEAHAVCVTCQEPISGGFYCESCEKEMVGRVVEAAKDKFVTKSGEEKEVFETGAQRDSQSGKLRFDLLPVPALKRVAELYRRGGERYGFGNWTKGIKFSRIMASAQRHFYQIMEGDESEDHESAVVWAMFSLMAYQHMIAKGKLPTDLDDLEGKEGILDG